MSLWSQLILFIVVPDSLRFVKDPEKDATLEGLDVLQEDKIKVYPRGKRLIETDIFSYIIRRYKFFQI